MIKEFTIKPEVFVAWCQSDEFKLFIKESLGLGTPRVLYPLPNKTKWIKATRKVYNSLGLGEIQEAKIEAAIELVTEITTEREVTFDHNDEWLKKVKDSVDNFRELFCVISDEEDESISPVSIVDFKKDSPWVLPHSIVLPRHIKTVTDYLEPFLLASKYVTIVDPYFDFISDKFKNTFDILLDQLMFKTGTTITRELTVFTSVKSKQDSELLQRHCREYFAGKQLPDGTVVKFILLERYTESEIVSEDLSNMKDDTHNRYIMSELGGIVCGKGFNLLKRLSRKVNETDDWYIMDRDSYDYRNSQYVNYATNFRVIDTYRA